MIISHRHKFIFIHIARTAGRSLTVDLQGHCGPDDIITPSGDHPGQNDHGWSRHATARNIRDRLGSEILREYFVFAVERDPWDKIYSFYWSKKGYVHGAGGKTEKVPFAERIWRRVSGYPWTFQGWLKYRFLRSLIPGFRRPFGKSVECYTDEKGALMVDAILRYEHLDQHIGLLSSGLGLSLTLWSKEGVKTRSEKRPYTADYSDWAKTFVADHYAQQIALMGYEFGCKAPDNIVGEIPLRTTPSGPIQEGSQNVDS
jgi:hypothetical protein